MLKLAEIVRPENARALVEEGAAVGGRLTTEQEDEARNVFMVLHGMYGNLFFSRYTTGMLEEDESSPDFGQDKGMANARRTWAYSLRSFSVATIKAALSATRAAFPEFPPNMPQFEALCRARAPRKVLGDKDAVVKLTMGQEVRSRYARQAREINARHAQRAKELSDGFRELPDGLAGLKEAVANAVATAGGDEVATLLRLDRELAPKVSHA